ncbi:hypothetical protein SGP15004_43760 [Shigella flexneri]|nr:hypothetical protein SGP12048_44380 [Shigella flexneri]GLG19598.1 hypothetical protein SGP12049_44140 [Shigella flexneri]GLG24126.1 hypothetical protein SGP14013_45200 [Shigella flexneri]GLG28647.1 hypothetical protein SGP14014_45000 [Shigella flexneri]GLG37359.1 hypothetical protein SGP15004_43760 [Shigella flexneri]
MPEAFRFQVNSEVWKDEAPRDISINPGAATPNLNNSDGSPFFAWRQYKHADEICPCGSHSAVFDGAGIYASGRRLAV